MRKREHFIGLWLDDTLTAHWTRNSTPSNPSTPSRPSVPSNPSTPSTPSTPDDSTDIPDEEPPLAELPDEDIPLAGAPEEEEDFDIFEEDVPLASAPSQNSNANSSNVTIDDDAVPLAAVPTTGDESAVWFYLAILSASCLLCLAVVELKKSKKN